MEEVKNLNVPRCTGTANQLMPTCIVVYVIGLDLDKVDRHSNRNYHGSNTSMESQN